MGSTNWRAVVAGVAMICTASGCEARSTFEFDALDLAPQQDQMSEFLLGEYSIPIPLLVDRGGQEPARRNHYQLDFELYALVRPGSKAQVADDWAKHEGQIRDHVIRVCRNASVDELQEPELSTLKARLMDALAVHIGEDDVRQLLITEVVSQPL